MTDKRARARLAIAKPGNEAPYTPLVTNNKEIEQEVTERLEALRQWVLSQRPRRPYARTATQRPHSTI